MKGKIDSRLQRLTTLENQRLLKEYKVINTPTFFINEYELPDQYDICDFKYFSEIFTMKRRLCNKKSLLNHQLINIINKFNTLIYYHEREGQEIESAGSWKLRVGSKMILWLNPPPHALRFLTSIALAKENLAMISCPDLSLTERGCTHAKIIFPINIDSTCGMISI